MNLFLFSLFFSNLYIIFSCSSNIKPSDTFIPGFGAVRKDGYGVCYSILDDHFKCGISVFKGNETKIDKFRETLSKTLYDMRDLVFQSQNSKL